jgi:histidinol-phosphate/aromatic aminotransferase/cobyric acid decarboxylase-like protein/choline kinase
MQAIILAAGMGKRLKDLTKDSTKCMVRVNGVTLIERMLFQLDKLDLSRIIVVVGYKSERLIAYISTLAVHTPIIYVENDVYSKTNNIFSLYLARDYLLKEDTLLLESDLIFTDAVLQKIVEDPYPSLALVAKYESWMDGTVVTLDEHNNITDFLGKKEFNFDDIHRYYKTVNIYKFSKQFSNMQYVPFLEAYRTAQGNNEYYEQVLKVIGRLDRPEIKATVLENESWYEIDDAQDLDIAESIFSSSSGQKLAKIQERHGGYWRYPQLLDFCYLVNPFYPPKRMMDEIRTNIETLIGNYPSGLDVNNLIAAKCFGIQEEHVCVGNGASEIINSLMKTINGKIGYVLPTFEEYPNRTTQDNLLPFRPNKRDFTYTSEDLIGYYDDLGISALLLINPDNPTGNFIERVDILRLAKWSEKRGIRLIVDESFIDFSNSVNSATLLSKKIFQNYKKLAVVKSISKSFGIPGLRLGIIASADMELIQHIRSDMSIWNINSIAEFYMQISEKYKNDYQYALERFWKVREDFLGKLRGINNLRVLPTQANFVMCEVLGDYSATQLTEILLCEYNILIKDLSAKKGIDGQYIRIAVRKKEENDLLVFSLHKLFSGEVGQKIDRLA